MADCKECVKCEGTKVSSNCIIWEGKEIPFSSFNELIEFLYEKSKNKESKLDFKTISTSTDNSTENAIQILIDRQVSADHKNGVTNTGSTSNTNTTIPCKLDVSALDNCSTCTKTECEKLQLLVSEIAMLKAEVNQLKQQL